MHHHWQKSANLDLCSSSYRECQKASFKKKVLFLTVRWEKCRISTFAELATQNVQTELVLRQKGEIFDATNEKCLLIFDLRERIYVFVFVRLCDSSSTLHKIFQGSTAPGIRL